ncbi:MAG: hypothetical protein A2W28_06195 [Gammaproteobacteria bacterium RBG_16_51_14]|nr:MAG: hypothetical protein A2W28_06195 [Gammaproteobacteria bacterium RBG_16_51_14]
MPHQGVPRSWNFQTATKSPGAILNSAQALTRRAYTMEGMRKSKNEIGFSHIINGLTAIENAGTSLSSGNHE